MTDNEHGDYILKRISIYNSDKNAIINVFSYGENKLSLSCKSINNFDNYSLENSIFIICKIDDKSIKFINKCWKNGIAVICNYHLPNCIPFKNEKEEYNLMYINDVILNYKKNYLKHTTIEILKESFKSKYKSQLPIIYIPIYGRHNILNININLLKLQTIKCNIVLGVSNKEDEDFIKKYDINYVYCLNRPLSLKFHILLSYCKIYNSQYLICLGSDDFLSLNFVENMINHMNEGYDFVGCNLWYMLTENQAYIKSYTSSKSIGSGRLLNSDILDKIKWL